MTPDFQHEDALGGRVAGVDEVGRGPWAGPVVACAVILDRDGVPEGLRDSKALKAKRRAVLSAAVLASAAVGIGLCEVEEIDRLGVGKATLLAMRRAIDALPSPPDAAIVDGLWLPDGPADLRMKPLPKGDALSASVAAASIVAKVHRDELMTALAAEHPGYAWERNKGYGTADHAAGLDVHGVTPHHRRSFAPIARRLSSSTA